MPKPTFHNLPTEKRNRITELALDEFATQPYRQASLSRIVQRAGIAKGSMYQYFENKLDLYSWLVTDELERRRLEWLQSDSPQDASSPAASEAASETGSLFEDLEQLVVTRVGFMLAHPRLARLAMSAMEPSADSELRELHGSIWRREVDTLAQRLEAAREAGEVRADLDPRTAAHLIDALILRGTTNAVLDRLDVDVHEFLTTPSSSARLENSAWRELVRDALNLIRAGIGAEAQTHADAGPAGSRDEDRETHLRPVSLPQLEWRASLEEPAPSC